MPPSVRVSIAPMLSVRGGARAIEFYSAAFGAETVYRIEDPDGNVVARLAIEGAEFWVVDGEPQPLDGSALRIVLTVPDPDATFARAVDLGAQDASGGVYDQHGWRTGRLIDPFGHHWEVSLPLGDATQ